MRRTTFWLACSLTLLLGCGGVRSYDTRATYDAPVNGYRLEIKTKGTLPWGEDLNPTQVGTVTITPLGGAANPTVTLDFTGGATVACMVGPASRTAPWDNETDQVTFRDLLTKAGYKVASAAEVEESVWAISGALSGPKSTWMSGQTKALNVIRVTFQ